MHTAHKRQHCDNYEKLDREKLENAIITEADNKQDKDAKEDSEEMAGPSLDLFFPQAADKEADSRNEKEDEEEDYAKKHGLPISHQVTLESHEKSI